eukprot:2836862-Rhodomonas_salina.6
MIAARRASVRAGEPFRCSRLVQHDSMRCQSSTHAPPSQPEGAAYARIADEHDRGSSGATKRSLTASAPGSAKKRARAMGLTTKRMSRLVCDHCERRQCGPGSAARLNEAADDAFISCCVGASQLTLNV